MSIRTYKLLKCDVCGREEILVDGKAKAGEVRALFPKYRHFWGRDYCPKCWTAAKRQWPALTARFDEERRTP